MSSEDVWQLFAAVRERILARRDSDRLAQEFAELAAMSDEEIDEFELNLANRKEGDR